ncbi:MAG: ferrous iron transport protein B [Clostridiales bacterium]|nr:ferrous iron transport protein B [Clostridiales bacterium]
MNKYIKFNNKKPKPISKRPNTATTHTVALCGNPNSGKTTLFNVLTGSNQKVGNWPGVTVERKTGVCTNDPTVAIVDTPGIYSLSPYTPEEQVARTYLTEGNPDLIINVVDSTNLERNLYLTCQLADLGIPMVVALNMQDEAAAKGITIDGKQLEREFGCKFFGISAAKRMGVKELMDYCIDSLQKSPKSVDNIAKNDANTAKTPEQRYAQIEKVVNTAQKIEKDNVKTTKAQQITEKIDKIVLNKWLAFPIFAAVMAIVFYISIGSVGAFLTGLINDRLTPALKTLVTNWLSGANVPWLTSLIVDGVIGGVMSVVGFLPQIMLLFGCISILEASGYMSRIAFITDRLLHKIGLGGRSFVSMILGCGCSVPAIMATRTIKNVHERDTTITLTPFMPCSAKLAIISCFTSYVLGGNALFAISFYFVSILSIILGGLVIKLFRRNKRELDDAFIMELPSYRAPTPANVFKQMWERGKAFLIKAGTVIFVASVALWLLTNFDFKFQFADTENSMLAWLGKLIAPIFTPLGFNDGGYGWQYSVATLTGIAAKETVVTTLEILLPNGVKGTISGLGAYSFVVFNLLTVPCVAAISASFTEQGSFVKGVKSMLFQIVTAYTVSLVIYQLGSLCNRHPAAFAIIVSALVLVVGLFFAVRYIIKNRHRSCGSCKHCALKQSCKK